MVWVKDQYGNAINIEKFKRISYYEIIDSKTNKIAFYKICLDECILNSEYELGYVKECDDELLINLSKGIEIYLVGIEDITTFYLLGIKEFEYEDYEKTDKKIKNEIDKGRFEGI